MKAPPRLFLAGTQETSMYKLKRDARGIAALGNYEQGTYIHTPLFKNFEKEIFNRGNCNFYDYQGLCWI